MESGEGGSQKSSLGLNFLTGRVGRIIFLCLWVLVSSHGLVFLEACAPNNPHNSSVPISQVRLGHPGRMG